jgi:hypothetical protein
MKLILLVVGGIVLANIVVATFFWHPKVQPKAFTTANSATARGLDPWMANEKYNAPGREHIRKGVLGALGKPWAEFCTTEGHKRLVDTVNHYYGQRDAQARSYRNTYGEAAMRYVIRM